MADKEGTIRMAGMIIVRSTTPDVCLTPMGNSMVPMPYTITARFVLSVSLAETVRMKASATFVLRSCIPMCTGDERGVGGGIKSGTIMSKCEPVLYSTSVRAEKSWVVRHDDPFWMNNQNTLGKAIYAISGGPVEGASAELPEAAPDAAQENPPPAKKEKDTNPPVKAETAAEQQAAQEGRGMLGEAGHQAVGVAKGAGKAVWEMGEGLWHAVTSPIETVKGIGTAIAHPVDALNAATAGYQEAWAAGNYGEAVGRGIVDIGSMFIGAGEAKAATKVAEAGEAMAKMTAAAEKIGEASKAIKATEEIGKTGKAVGAIEKGAETAKVMEKGSETAKAVEKTAVEGKNGTTVTKGETSTRKNRQPSRKNKRIDHSKTRKNADGSTTYTDKTGREVTYDKNGHADFTPHAEAEVQIDGLTGNHPLDEAMANKAVGLESTPKDYTWHHVQDGKTMQLVPRDVHQTFPHTGGASILKGR